MRGHILQRRHNGTRLRRCLLAGLLAASGPNAGADETAPWLPLPLVTAGADTADHPFFQPPGTVASRHLTIVPGSASLPSPATAASPTTAPSPPAAATASGKAADQPVAASEQTVAGQGNTPLQWQAAAIPAPTTAAAAAAEGASNIDVAAPVELVQLMPLEPAAATAAISPLLTSPPHISLSATDPAASDAQPVGYSVSFSDSAQIELDMAEPSTLVRPAAPLLSAPPAPPVQLSLSDARSDGASPRLTEPQVAPSPAAELVPSRTAMRRVETWNGAALADEPRLVNGGRPRVEVERSPVAIDRQAASSIVSGNPRVLTVEGLPEPSSAADLGPGPSVEFVESKRPLATVMRPAAHRSLHSVLDQAHADDGWQAPAMMPPAATENAATKNAVADNAASQGDDASHRSAVQLSLSSDDDQTVAKPVKPVTLQLNPTDVRSLQLDATIVDIQCDNLDVCTLIRSAANSLQVIATGHGRAHLVVHAVNKQGRQQVEQYVITVGHSRDAGGPTDDVAMALTQTVQNAFPGANVLVTASDGRLIVTGSCPDENTARRILRMVRSACVIPVVDQVLVR